MRNKVNKNSTIEDYHSNIRYYRTKAVRGRRLVYILSLIGILGFISIFEADSADYLNIGLHNSYKEYFTYQILFISLCLLLSSAFFSATETAFFSLRATQLKRFEESKYYRDRLIARLMVDPANFLTTILMGNAIVNIGLSIVFGVRMESFLMEKVFVGRLGGSWISYALACIISTFILIIGGEITPKLIALRYAEIYAHSVVLLIFLLHLIFSPIRKIFLYFTGVVFKVTGFSTIPPFPWITDDEFVEIVKQKELSPMIAEHEREMIQGILQFRDEPVKKILVPRTEIVAIPSKATVKDAWEIFCKHEYSRMPVYEDNLDHIVGMLYAKDLLDYVEMNQWKVSVRPISRRAYFIPETTTISEFIKFAQRVNTHLAIVVDEYGGTSGLVTLHDAFREIIGDIADDEQEESQPEYVKVGENEYLIDGMMAISDLEELVGCRLDDPEHTTVAGFLFKIHENVTSPGDVIEVGPLKFTIEEMDGNRIAKVRLVIRREDTEDSEKGGRDFEIDI